MNMLKKMTVLTLCLSLAICSVACNAPKNGGETTAASVATEKMPLCGGWSTEKPTKLTDNQKALFDKAMEGLTGVSYTPELYLGSQVVAGYNYRFLCKAQVVAPGASETWAIVQIYEDLDGNATVTEVTNLTNEEAAQYGVEPATSETVQIANPFVDCDSFEAAATVAGFAITAPETVEAYPNRMIQAVAENMIQVFYTTGDLADERTEHILVRKAVGSEDVSGDYNDYASVTEQDINGTTVTLKGDGKLIFLAVWTDGDFSYSVAVSNGTDLDTMLKLANTLE